MRDLTVWKGLRGSSGTKTCHGYDYDVMISGVQKYLRAGDSKGMQYCALEILCLEQPAATSNLLHRLQVMAGEELLFADVGTFSDVYELLGFVEKDRGNAFAMLEACELLARGRLCRLPSDIRCHFGTLGAGGLRQLMDSTPVPASFQTGVVYDHPSEVVRLARMFAYQLSERRSYECFYPLFEVLRLSAEGSVGQPIVLQTRLRDKPIKRVQSAYLLWGWLLNYSHGFRATMEQQLEWFTACLARQPKPKLGVATRPARDYYVFLVNVVLLVLQRDVVAPLPKRDPLELGSEASELAEQLRAHRLAPHMELLPTVVDMHTHAGRRAGKTGADFATEGAVLAREDREFFVQQWRDQYVQYKVSGAGDHRTKKRAHSIKAEPKPVKKAKKIREAPSTALPDARMKMKPAEKFEGVDFVPFEQLSGPLPPLFCNGGKVCGQKPAVFKVVRGGHTYACKEVHGVATQFGRAYTAMHKLKVLVTGVRAPAPVFVMSDKVVRRTDLSNHSFVDNWHLVDDTALYILLPFHPGVTLADVPDWHKVRWYRQQYLRIVLMRAVLLCSDTSARNVLCDPAESSLHSIDESHILSERSKVLGRTSQQLRELWRVDINNGYMTQIFQSIASIDADAVVRILNEERFDGEANRAFITERLAALERLAKMETFT